MLGRIMAAMLVPIAIALSAGVAARPPAHAPVPREAALAGEKPSGARPLAARDVTAWLDRTVPPLLERNEIAGAAVVVVSDGRIVASKGYGYADVATRRPVDPRRTLFRPGSISKLFVWTAVMQQVERGRIDLDADINRYLEFRIPPRSGWRAITMRDLMTHRAGFEDAERALIRHDPTRVRPLGELLAERVPERIYAPGTVTAYSNYGAALAAHVVERVSGLDFGTYVQRAMFDPLGMRRSSFAQPLPTALRADLSNGYAISRAAPAGFETIDMAPAGGLSATGIDMAAFMIAHLNAFRGRAPRLLSPATERTMLTTRTQNGAGFPANLLGFYEAPGTGTRTAMHEGDTDVFHSHLGLFLDHDVGFFLSLNSTGTGEDVRRLIVQGFRARFIPDSLGAPAGLASLSATDKIRQAQALAGNYQSTRRSVDNPTELGRLLTQFKLTARPDGSIASMTGLDHRPDIWHPVGPFLWRIADGSDYLAATVKGGAVTGFRIRSLAPLMAFERVGVWRSAALIVPALKGSLAILFAAALGWPLVGLWRRWRPDGGNAPMRWRAEGLSWLSGTLALVIVTAWAALLAAMLAGAVPTDERLDGWIVALRVGGGAGLALAFLGAVGATPAFSLSKRPLSTVAGAAVAAATLVTVYAGAAFGLFGLDPFY